jgi:hypothetical protein
MYVLSILEYWGKNVIDVQGAYFMEGLTINSIYTQIGSKILQQILSFEVESKHIYKQYEEAF